MLLNMKFCHAKNLKHLFSMLKLFCCFLPEIENRKKNIFNKKIFGIVYAKNVYEFCCVKFYSMQKRSGIFLSLKDIMLICGCKQTAAWRLRQTIKDALQKKKHQKITLKEFADYEGVSICELETLLNS